MLLLHHQRELHKHRICNQLFVRLTHSKRVISGSFNTLAAIQINVETSLSIQPPWPFLRVLLCAAKRNRECIFPLPLTQIMKYYVPSRAGRQSDRRLQNAPRESESASSKRMMKRWSAVSSRLSHQGHQTVVLDGNWSSPLDARSTTISHIPSDHLEALNHRQEQQCRLGNDPLDWPATDTKLSQYCNPTWRCGGCRLLRRPLNT